MPLSNSKASRHWAYKSAGSGFRAASARPCKVPVSKNIWLLSLLCNELLSMGGWPGGRNELQCIFLPQLRPGGSTWLGSAGPAECHQTVDLEFAVLGCVCCYKCCAGPCERVTIHRLRQAHVALTGGSAWRARRLVASQTLCPVGISCSDNHPQRGNHKDIQAGPRAQVSWAPLLCQAAFLRTSEHSHIKRPSDSGSAFVVGWPLGRTAGQL